MITPIPEFPGRIGRTLADSEPYFVEPPHPADGAPNVVVVLLDDLGFGHFGCYGSDIDTRHVDALAEGGLRYTNFHVTPLCSPTRAALLTGRNHHTVGMRGVSNFNTGFPHMTGHISNHAATVAEVLHDEGYATFAVGKWHLAPMEQCSAAGPFDQWPLQRGFDRFYGFLEGETDQFAPTLTYDNHHIDQPADVDAQVLPGHEGLAGQYRRGRDVVVAGNRHRAGQVGGRGVGADDHRAELVGGDRGTRRAQGDHLDLSVFLSGDHWHGQGPAVS